MYHIVYILIVYYDVRLLSLKCSFCFFFSYQDNNLAEFITEVMQYISLLDIERKLFVEALLQINWTNRSSQVIFTYKLFLQNLACMQTFHTNIVINCLVELFKPSKFYIYY